MNALAKIALIVSWCITFWAVAVCVSVSCAIKRPKLESPHQYQAADSDSHQSGNSLLHEEASAWVTAVIPAAAGLLGAVLGGIITYLSSEKIRRRKSIYDIADIFAKEAKEWAERRYLPDNPIFIKWHNDIITELSPHVNYLERRHEKICGKIWDHWVFFHGGNAGTPITKESYSRVKGSGTTALEKISGQIGKDEWSHALYSIADILRES